MAVFTLLSNKFMPAKLYVPPSGKIFIDVEAERPIWLFLVSEAQLPQFQQGRLHPSQAVLLGTTNDLKRKVDLFWPKNSFFYLVMQNPPQNPSVAVFFRITNIP